MKVVRPINEPIRPDGGWDERWERPDQGLIACWERGREKAEEDPVLAAEARGGQLVILPFKGGVRGLIKTKVHGSLLYLAMWQGLRGDDLDIDTDMGRIVRCTDSGMQVQFIVSGQPQHLGGNHARQRQRPDRQRPACDLQHRHGDFCRLRPF